MIKATGDNYLGNIVNISMGTGQCTQERTLDCRPIIQSFKLELEKFSPISASFLQFQLSDMRSTLYMYPNPPGQCYKISPKWNDTFAKPLDFPSLWVGYRFDIAPKVVSDDSVSAYFTS